MSQVDLIKQLVTVCRDAGIRRIRVGDVEIEFGAEQVDKSMVEETYKMMEKSMPTDEDMLFYSAPGYVPTTEREQPAPMPKARGKRAQ